MLLALLWPQAAGANEVESKKSELDALKQRLQSLQRESRAAEEHRTEAADELRQSERSISEAVRQFDFTVLGRTPRAFDSHPRTQRDTETVINRLFGQVSGYSWNDVTSGARGVSRAAAEVIVAQVDDDELSTDVSWPLYLQHHGAWSIGYVETEGLEFETADRFADEVAATGYAAWLDRLENDPQEWAFRFDLARVGIEALLPYTGTVATAR
jgi:hypothetical protein